MPKPKILSGKDVITVFEEFGFVIVSQKGSHVKLRRETAGGRQTLTLPCHKEIDIGTSVAIYRQALRFISEEELRSHFYSK